MFTTIITLRMWRFAVDILSRFLFFIAFFQFVFDSWKTTRVKMEPISPVWARKVWNFKRRWNCQIQQVLRWHNVSSTVVLIKINNGMQYVHKNMNLHYKRNILLQLQLYPISIYTVTQKPWSESPDARCHLSQKGIWCLCISICCKALTFLTLLNRLWETKSRFCWNVCRKCLPEEASIASERGAETQPGECREIRSASHL